MVLCVYICVYIYIQRTTKNIYVRVPSYCSLKKKKRFNPIYFPKTSVAPSKGVKPASSPSSFGRLYFMLNRLDYYRTPRSPLVLLPSYHLSLCPSMLCRNSYRLFFVFFFCSLSSSLTALSTAISN